LQHQAQGARVPAPTDPLHQPHDTPRGALNPFSDSCSIQHHSCVTTGTLTCSGHAPPGWVTPSCAGVCGGAGAEGEGTPGHVRCKPRLSMLEHGPGAPPAPAHWGQHPGAAAPVRPYAAPAKDTPRLALIGPQQVCAPPPATHPPARAACCPCAARAPPAPRPPPQTGPARRAPTPRTPTAACTAGGC